MWWGHSTSPPMPQKGSHFSTFLPAPAQVHLFNHSHPNGWDIVHTHIFSILMCQAWSYLGMRRWQPPSYVNAKESILPKGDVELQELWLTDVNLRPPKYPWWDLLCHSTTNFCFSTVYAAVLQ